MTYVFNHSLFLPMTLPNLILPDNAIQNRGRNLPTFGDISSVDYVLLTPLQLTHTIVATWHKPC